MEALAAVLAWGQVDPMAAMHLLTCGMEGWPLVPSTPSWLSRQEFSTGERGGIPTTYNGIIQG
jgi:hypothetical protein